MTLTVDAFISKWTASGGTERASSTPVVVAMVVALAQGCGNTPLASDPATPPGGAAVVVSPHFPGCRQLRKGARVDVEVNGEDLVHVVGLVSCLTGRKIAIDDAAAPAKVSFGVKAGTADDLSVALVSALEAVGKNVREVEGVLVIRDNTRATETSSVGETTQ